MPPTKDYEIPKFGTPAAQIHGWCLEAEQEGRAWLQTQKPVLSWEKSLSAISGDDAGESIEGLSNLGYNKVGRVARELVASLSNFRHEGEYTVTWNNELYDRAKVLTNLDENWYRTANPAAAHRGALQYGIATGTAYLLETWDKHFWSPYRGDIRLSAISPADVTFVQLPKDHDIQRAYAVIIREELPINLARAIYQDTNPAFANALVPDRDTPGWLQKGLQKVQKFLSPALRVAGRTQKDQTSSFPTVDVFHMYVLDRSVNEGSVSRQMGIPGTNWSYIVPALGDPIPTELVNPATGNFFTIPATHEHCRLFPLRRYVIFSRTAVAYDNSSPYWHGHVPLARIRFNDWIWEALGQSLVGDLKTMQDGIVSMMRAIEDSAHARLDPPAIYDDTMSSTWAEAFNPRRAGVRARAPLSSGIDPIKYPVPPQYYDVPQWITNWIEQQEGRMDYMAGVRDLVAIAKAQQVPGADTLEKLMEMAGPIVQDLVRQVEEPLQQLGEWRKANYFQFYTRQRVLTITGPEGNDLEVTYKPEQLIPLMIGETPTSRATRGRQSLDDFRYKVTESGINQIHRMTTKLFYTQLMKMGFPISWWTFAKIAQIPNFGPPPKGTNNEMERWVAQQRIQTDLAMDQQEQVLKRQAQMGMVPGAEGDGGGGEGGGGEGGGEGDNSGGGGPEGRPPSFNKPPRIAQKDGGTRSTITTS